MYSKLSGNLPLASSKPIATHNFWNFKARQVSQGNVQLHTTLPDLGVYQCTYSERRWIDVCITIHLAQNCITVTLREMYKKLYIYILFGLSAQKVYLAQSGTAKLLVPGKNTLTTRDQLYLAQEAERNTAQEVRVPIVTSLTLVILKFLLVLVQFVTVESEIHQLKVQLYEFLQLSDHLGILLQLWQLGNIDTA